MRPSRQPLNILFVGNSFTYGPPAWADEDPQRNRHEDLKNIPRLFKLVAESLGHKVNQAEDTIGGCTLWMHRPSVNPEGCTNTLHCPRVHQSAPEHSALGSLTSPDRPRPATEHAQPSASPPPAAAPRHCQPVANARVGANESCTVSAAIAAPAVGLPAIADQYAPCPQLLMRQPYGPWDVVVVQDQSSLPFVHAARCAGALEP